MKSAKEIEGMFSEGEKFLKDLNKLIITETDIEETHTLRLASTTMFARLQVMAWVLDKPDLEPDQYLKKL